MSERLELGDVVTFKSGSAPLTITVFEDADGQWATCSWFNYSAEKFEHESIPVALLVKHVEAP